MMERLRNLWRVARAVPYVIPQVIIERLSMAVRNAHEPYEGMCLRCCAKAPCQHFIDATERVYEARIAVANYWARALPDYREEWKP